MFKRQTSKVRRRSRNSVLQARVMSPRIAWFGFLKFFGGILKIACVLAVLATAGWGIWKGVQRAFYQNPDFKLQVIDLNPNPAIDEAGLVDATGIDINSTLFDIDVEKVVEHLKSLPKIADAHAERHLPGTLMVRVTAREPRAWVACPDAGISAERRIGGMLVDAEGFAYACPQLQFEIASHLPVILLPVSETHTIVPGEKVGHPALQHCFRLLSVAEKEDAESIHWIESIEQTKEWALTLITREGTEATFGLGDHARQVSNFRAALDHAHRKNFSIATINLIPKENVPVTIRDEAEPPRAIPVLEPTPGEIREDRRTRDLNTLLNRG